MKLFKSAPVNVKFGGFSRVQPKAKRCVSVAFRGNAERRAMKVNMIKSTFLSHRHGGCRSSPWDLSGCLLLCVLLQTRVCPRIACLQTGTPTLTTTGHTSRCFQGRKKIQTTLRSLQNPNEAVNSARKREKLQAINSLKPRLGELGSRSRSSFSLRSNSASSATNTASSSR